MSKKWKNWAGNESAQVLSIETPSSEDELAQIVSRAGALGHRVKVAGSGHSFTPAAVTDGHLVRIQHLQGVYSVDRSAGTVTVGAGTTLKDLNWLLQKEGLAMANLGDIAYQTVAGAISTGTHGTGRMLPGLAAQIVGLRIIDGQGTVLNCSSIENPDVLEMARISVGALGAITQCTIKVEDAFRLHAQEVPMRLKDVLQNIDELVNENDHFEFFWIPHTKWALTKRNNRTSEDLRPIHPVRKLYEKTFMENVGFGAVCHLGRLRPSLIPRLATALPSSGSRDYVDQSFKIFASPRLVHFYEMEYSVPRAALVDVMSDVQSMIEKKGYLLNFPVEVRVTAPDDVPLSTSYGRDSAYVAVHVFRGMQYKDFFQDVEEIMCGYDARPHWGKIHNRNADDLQGLYPRFEDFLLMRNRLDPGRVFANRYTDRVFGS